MLFSVVLCTYNRADEVGAAVKRVLDQSFTDFELVVVNDGSVDHTAEVLASFTDPRLRVVHQENGGLSAARNGGIAAAQGRLVAFLDDDDPVEPGWLAGLAAGVDDSTGLTNCACRFAYDNGRTTFVYATRPHSVFPHIEGVFMAGTFALDRIVAQDIGGYAEGIRVSHQSELLLRAIPELEARNLTSVHTTAALITIDRRSADDRPLSQPIDLRDGAEYLIEHHGPLLATQPKVLGDYRAVAGVCSAKLGEPARARRHLVAAVRAHPLNPKHWVRAAVSFMPPIARRVWRAAG